MPRDAPPEAHDGRNIFMVSTPFQFIVAKLIARRTARPCRFIVVTDFADSVHQIKRLAQDFGQDDLALLSRPVRSLSRPARLANETLRFARTLRIKARLRPDDRLFIGFPLFALNRPLMFQRRCGISLFDEGTATIGFLTRRSVGETTFTFSPPSPFSYYTALYPRQLRLDAVRFHTIYPGLRGAPGDEIVAVPLQLPQAFNRPKDVARELWFIGGPLVQQGVLGRPRWHETFEAVRRAAREANLRLVYFPHRTERDDPELAGVEMRRPDVPFEPFVGWSPTRPVAVLSIVSSALLNTRVFFGDSCPVALVDPEDALLAPLVQRIHPYSSENLGIPVLRGGDLGPFIAGLAQRSVGDG